MKTDVDIWECNQLHFDIHTSIDRNKVFSEAVIRNARP